jgi:hypothetical protein
MTAAMPRCLSIGKYVFVNVRSSPCTNVRGNSCASLREQQLHVGVEDGFASARKVHPAIRVAAGELDVLAERLRDAGEQVVWDEALAGVGRFYSQDHRKTAWSCSRPDRRQGGC